MAPILSFVGKSGCGKTTVIEKLIAALKQRNCRIAVVKHHAHTTPIDGPGKDSWRFAEAGANAVFVSSPVEIARFERVTRELTLTEIAARIENVDLILTEGFKRENAPKIEVSRQAWGTDLVARAEELVAVVSDHPISLPVPRFELDDIQGLTDFVVSRYVPLDVIPPIKMDQTRILVLTGESGTGKTVLCERLATLCHGRSLDVAGILTPPRFAQGQKVGIDVLDIRSGERRPLAERESHDRGLSMGVWHFHAEALTWGAQILAQAFPCDLLIVDELGPLELERDEGWINAIDLLRQQKARALVVVRPTLLEKLKKHLEGIDVVAIAVTRANQDTLLAQLAAFAGGAP